MATHDDADGSRRVPTQEEYAEETRDSTWVDLEDGPGSMKILELPPLKLIRDMKQYGVSDLLGMDDGDDIDMEALIVDGDFTSFLEATVLPNVLEPTCYWTVDEDAEETVGDADGDFDLAELTANDLMIVITSMTGQDPADLEERLDDRFPGESGGTPGASDR